MRFVKRFFGILLCVCAFGFTIATEQVDCSMQPFFIGLVCACIVGAVFLLKSSRKSKIQASKTHTTIAEGDLVTVKTDNTSSSVPDDIANEMREHYTFAQAQRDVQIMVDSYSLASATKNLETFCSRYTIAMQKAHTLLQAEQIGVHGIKKLNCHNTCRQVIDSANALRVRVLHDYETDCIYKAEALKTDRGRKNQYAKMLLELEKAESIFMFMDEYDALTQKIKSVVNELEGISQ